MASTPAPAEESCASALEVALGKHGEARSDQWSTDNIAPDNSF